MAYEQRRLVNNLSGTLSARAAATDSQITCQGSAPGISNVFASLPTDFSSALYMPLVLANDATGKFEVVWVTGHASASPTLTVVRNREGTDGQAFEVGDVVRCAATQRDLGGLVVATRSALPGDAHIGMKATIADEGLAVERTAFGWNDSAPLADDGKRKHHWSASGLTVSQQSSSITMGPLGAASNNPSSPIATLGTDRSSILLNKPGWWSLCWQAIVGSTVNGSVYVEMYWPSGAFPIGIAKGQTSHRLGGSGVAGNQVVSVEWSGYVPAAAAAAPIALRAFQQNANAANMSMSFDATAEYAGR